jgi:hypothetical protein
MSEVDPLEAIQTLDKAAFERYLDPYSPTFSQPVLIAIMNGETRDG